MFFFRLNWPVPAVPEVVPRLVGGQVFRGEELPVDPLEIPEGAGVVRHKGGQSLGWVGCEKARDRTAGGVAVEERSR